MKPFLLPCMALLLACLSTYSQSEYLALSSGYLQSQHQYLSDESKQQGALFRFEADYRHRRRTDTGWFARGPKLEAMLGASLLHVKGQLPLYQWQTHQGSWLEIDWAQQDMQGQLSEGHIFMGKEGQVASLAQDSDIGSTRYFQRLQVYWYESSQYHGVINLAGLSYGQEATPAVANIANTNATLFDGQFTGVGIMIGRAKDKRGFNFQWRLNVASLESDFSNDITQHRSLSKQESSVYKLALTLNWHYRYYLAPYWYLVPQIQYQLSYLTQGQSKPLFVEHESFTYTQQMGLISLRRYLKF